MNNILTNSVVVQPGNVYTKFEANLCSGSRKEVGKQKKFKPTTTMTYAG